MVRSGLDAASVVDVELEVVDSTFGVVDLFLEKGGWGG